MFRFADPNFLYLLILLPFLVALYLYSNYHRRQNIRKYGDPALLKGLMPTISKYRPDIKFWLTFAALTLVILMLARLDKYLDDAYIAHLKSVRIVHGKGTGALRKGVHNYLKRQKHVESFRLGEFGEGDAGVTIVEFKK